MFDIVIIGGGLAGLTMAASLAKKDITTAIIEKKNLNQKDESERKITLSSGTINFYKKIGVAINTQNTGKVATIIITKHGNNCSTIFDAQAIHLENMAYVINNNDIINLLMQSIKPNITIFDNNKNYNINKTNQGFKITIDNQIINAKIIIVADGAKSEIFNIFGIKKTTFNYNQTALMFDIQHQNPHNNIATEHFTPNGPFATLPMSDLFKSNVIWSQSSALHSSFNEKTINNDMAEYLPKWLGKSDVITKVIKFPLSIQIAKKHYHNGIFLLGATARNLHPLAGQAFNVIVQDIQVLSEVIDDWHKNGAQIQNLYKYAIKYRCKRIIPGFEMSMFTHLTNSVFSSNSAILNLSSNSGIRIINAFSSLRRFFMTHSTGK